MLLLGSNALHAEDLIYGVNIMTQEKGKTNDFVLGKEISAVILPSFRIANHDNMTFTVSHIRKLPSPGDQHLDRFWNMWTEMLNNIAPEDWRATNCTKAPPTAAKSNCPYPISSPTIC